MTAVSLVEKEVCDVVCMNVDVVDGATKVMVVSVAVDCRGVVWTGVVWIKVVVGVVVGNGIVENDPMVCEVVVSGFVKSGIVDVCFIVEKVLVVDANVKLLPTHSLTIRLPCCASLSSVSSEFCTPWHSSSMLSSICLTPAIQEREQVWPLVKSADVQPVMKELYTMLQATDSKPSWTGCRSLSVTADAVDASARTIPIRSLRRRFVHSEVSILKLCFPTDDSSFRAHNNGLVKETIPVSVGLSRQRSVEVWRDRGVVAAREPGQNLDLIVFLGQAPDLERIPRAWSTLVRDEHVKASVALLKRGVRETPKLVPCQDLYGSSQTPDARRRCQGRGIGFGGPVYRAHGKLKRVQCRYSSRPKFGCRSLASAGHYATRLGCINQFSYSPEIIKQDRQPRQSLSRRSRRCGEEFSRKMFEENKVGTTSQVK